MEKGEKKIKKGKKKKKKINQLKSNFNRQAGALPG